MINACFCIRKNTIIIIVVRIIMVIEEIITVYSDILWKFNDIKKYDCVWKLYKYVEQIYAIKFKKWNKSVTKS